jgi:hypothetical protein
LRSIAVRRPNALATLLVTVSLLNRFHRRA